MNESCFMLRKEALRDRGVLPGEGLGVCLEGMAIGADWGVTR